MLGGGLIELLFVYRLCFCLYFCGILDLWAGGGGFNICPRDLILRVFSSNTTASFISLGRSNSYPPFGR